MEKSFVYVQKHFAPVLLAAVLGYIGWMGLELNALGKDVATLKANAKHVDYRLNAVDKRLDSITETLMRIDQRMMRMEQRMVRIEEGLLLSQGGKGGKKSGRAEKP